MHGGRDRAHPRAGHAVRARVPPGVRRRVAGEQRHVPYVSLRAGGPGYVVVGRFGVSSTGLKYQTMGSMGSSTLCGELPGRCAMDGGMWMGQGGGEELSAGPRAGDTT